MGFDRGIEFDKGRLSADGIRIRRRRAGDVRKADQTGGAECATAEAMTGAVVGHRRLFRRLVMTGHLIGLGGTLEVRGDVRRRCGVAHRKSRQQVDDRHR